MMVTPLPKLRIHPVLGSDKTLILLRDKEGNYPIQGTLADGRIVVNLSELRLK